MMLGKLKKFTIQMIAGANWATVVLMFLVGHADHVNPVKYPLLAVSGLAFPIFLLINLAFLLFWLTFHARKAWIPIVGYLVCYVPLRTYIPLHLQSDVPDGAIKVLSYNVDVFAHGQTDADGQSPILRYIRESDADIVCLQEASPRDIGQQKVNDALDDIYKYHKSAYRSYSGNHMTVYSKYPIVGMEYVEYESLWNVSAAFQIKINDDTVTVINNHLETNQIMSDEKEQLHEMMSHPFQEEANIKTSKMLVGRLCEAVQLRKPEVDSVANYIARHAGESMIVCGDFNDSPLSYARRTIAKHLTDCYVETGRGAGTSYNRLMLLFRIDYIMCTPDWEPYNCTVDSKIKTSDHYPIVCWLKKRPKH